MYDMEYRWSQGARAGIEREIKRAHGLEDGGKRASERASKRQSDACVRVKASGQYIEAGCADAFANNYVSRSQNSNK